MHRRWEASARDSLRSSSSVAGRHGIPLPCPFRTSVFSHLVVDAAAVFASSSDAFTWVRAARIEFHPHTRRDSRKTSNVALAAGHRPGGQRIRGAIAVTIHTGVVGAVDRLVAIVGGENRLHGGNQNELIVNSMEVSHPLFEGLGVGPMIEFDGRPLHLAKGGREIHGECRRRDRSRPSLLCLTPHKNRNHHDQAEGQERQ